MRYFTNFNYLGNKITFECLLARFPIFGFFHSDSFEAIYGEANFLFFESLTLA